MRILLVHNAYQYRGGEDRVVEAEIALLRSHGHQVETWFRSNHEIAGVSPPVLACDTLWSRQTTAVLTETLHRFQPDLVHAHNTFPLISPSLYWAASRAGVPVVQALHNFRLICLNALFLRDGQVCEDCMGKQPWRGVVRGCYRGSRTASLALAGMLALHRGLGTFRNRVTRYIALNDFCRDKFISGGLPADRVVVKPNFVDWCGDVPQSGRLTVQNGERKGMLFVGRLSLEKGIATLAEAKAMLPNFTLRVAGEGPSVGLLDGVPGVVRMGSLAPGVVRTKLTQSLALIVPSICYETFGLVISEAFSMATPVIASRIGALTDIVEEGVTGLVFEPGNATDLAEKMAWAASHPEEMAAMGCNARKVYEQKYTPEKNYEMLMNIYQQAIDDNNR